MALLIPVQIFPGDPHFQALLNTSFGSETFYEAQISRLLKDDISFRVMFSSGQIWIYQDEQRATVGFGTLDVCAEYSRFTEGAAHSYLPLLAVLPSYRGK